MKYLAALPIIMILCLVVDAYADMPETWCGVWGYTWKNMIGNDFVDVNVQCKSTAGNSGINQSYWNNDGDTQYDFDGNGGSAEIVYGRYYHSVDAWKGDYEGSAPGFTWTGGAIVRTIVLSYEPDK